MALHGLQVVSFLWLTSGPDESDVLGPRLHQSDASLVLDGVSVLRVISASVFVRRAQHPSTIYRSAFSDSSACVAKALGGFEKLIIPSGRCVKRLEPWTSIPSSCQRDKCTHSIRYSRFCPRF